MFHTIHVFSFCLWLVGVFGDEVKSVSVMEGQNVTLHTNLTELQTDHVIVWRFKDIRIAKIKRSDNINPTYNKTETFRDRLKMNNQTGDLTITHITSQHSGLYTLRINMTGKLNVKKNITVTVYAKEQTNGHPNYIIPFSCAAVGFLVVVALLIICKKQRNKQQQDQTREDQITYADPTFYQHDTKTKGAQEEDTVVYSGVVTKR
ncbi:uncharacterized protein LOC130430480 [Triplophysa dalaica]|uniref:uncharacterized protein LOC130430480 n=1 Tax=Triplophysa dalaica TaxID=1582913 RepID=UPI0024DF69AC|nr:uncharacterized protein LOC130430480 [Triplophysa dalaica]